MKFIPISEPSISELEIDFVTDAVKSTWISSLGKYIDRFEQEFATFCQSKYAVSVSNGTVAIHLALVALGIGEGDEVIMPDLSFIATANAVLHANATPIFVDIDPYNLCLDPTKIEAAITKNTKAILPVHLYGHPADMLTINKIAKKHKLIVIEDAAEAHGSTINNKRVGSWGKCATFSFYGNKNLTTGEGGMITTDDEELYLKCRHLRDHAMSKEKRYWHTEVGYNYRMTNLQAALGCAQLSRVDYFMKRRKEIFEQYNAYLKDNSMIKLNRTYPWATNSYWLICAEFQNFNEEKRTKLMKELRTKNIDSRPYFYPMSDMPYLPNVSNTPISHKIYQKGINLPTYTDISDEQIKWICDNLNTIILKI